MGARPAPFQRGLTFGSPTINIPARTGRLGKLGRRCIRNSLRLRHTLEGKFPLFTRPLRVDHDDLPSLDFPEQDLLREMILDLALDRAPERPSTEYRVVSALGEELLGRRRELDAHVAVLEPLFHL